jgi:hypothetical protein
MKLNQWYYIDKDGDPAILNSDRAPQGGLIMPYDDVLGRYEELVWVQVESIDGTDVDGKSFKYDEVRVNALLKAQILAQRDADKIADDQAKLDEKNRLKAIKDKAKLVKKDDIVDLNTIKDSIDALARAVEELNIKVFGADEG